MPVGTASGALNNSGAPFTLASGPATKPSTRWALSPLAMTTAVGVAAAICPTATLVPYRSRPAMRLTGRWIQRLGNPRRLTNCDAVSVAGVPVEETAVALLIDPATVRGPYETDTTSGNPNAATTSAWDLVRVQEAIGLIEVRLQWSSTLRRYGSGEPPKMSSCCSVRPPDDEKYGAVIGAPLEVTTLPAVSATALTHRGP